PSTILRVLPAFIHNIGISADHNAYTRPEPLAFTPRATFESCLALQGLRVGRSASVCIHALQLARHAETLIPTLKRLFKHSWGNASCRCSSVIAFDKVDQLLGVEVEAHSAYDTSWSSSSHATLPLSTRVASWSSGWRRVMNHFTSAQRDRRPPNKDARRNILMRVEERRLEKAPAESPLHFPLLAMQTEGYSATGLYNFVTSAMHQAAMRSTTPKDDDAARGTDPLSELTLGFMLMGVAVDTGYPRAKHMQD
ncbi:hypothetical protein FIBSPDRAFT_962003, partial [Athelia psychrophila]